MLRTLAQRRRSIFHKLMLQWIQDEVDSSDKLYLLHGRREPQKDGSPFPQTLRLRHYLFMVHTKKHRDTLTSVLLSMYQLAVEVLRWSDNQAAGQPDVH